MDQTLVSEFNKDAQIPDTAPDQTLNSLKQIMETERAWKLGAAQVIQLFVPVSACMLLVVMITNTIDAYTSIANHSRNRRVYLPYTPFHSKDASHTQKVWESVGNAFCMMSMVGILTIVISVLYKFKWYKVLYGWIVVSSICVFFMFFWIFTSDLFVSLNWPIDWFTDMFLCWNVGVVGMVAVFWKAPLLLQQAYLVCSAVLMSLIFIRFLPDWTVWALLAVTAVWDLFAVLAPYGPLRILVELAYEREEPLIPALVYSSASVYEIAVCITNLDDDVGITKKHDDPQSDSQVSWQDLDQSLSRMMVNHDGVRQRCRSQLLREFVQDSTPTIHDQDDTLVESNAHEDDHHAIHLGLGDFIFYSLLVGKASMDSNWNTTIACFCAVLIGLCITLLLLSTWKRAFPALPISIFLGLLFYSTSLLVIGPFCGLLAAEQVFL